MSAFNWSKWRLISGIYLGTTSMFAVQRVIVDLQSGQPSEIINSVLDLLIFSGLWVILAIPILLFISGRKLNFFQAVLLLAIGVTLSVLHAALYLAIMAQLPRLAPNLNIVTIDNFFSTLLHLNHAWRFLSFGFIVVLAYAYDYYHLSIQHGRRAAELQAQLSEARLQALTTQLQPHFLFNTLNAITVLIEENPARAKEMLGHLSDLLRLALENVEAQEVPLRREMEFLDRYLLIEQTRYGDRLTVHQIIDDETLNAHVPYLVLQPLVENAIRHGIAAVPGPGTIAIQAKRTNGQLVLSVQDSGPSFRPSNSTRTGIGLSNTRARLQQLYGEEHVFDHSTATTGGFCVTIRIPFRTDMPVKNS